MKIIFFGNTIKNLINFRKNLILNFIDKKNQIYLIFQKESKDKEYQDFFLKNGCKIYEVDFDRHSINPIKELITFYQLFKIYNKIKPDITFNFTIKPNIYGSIISRFLKIYSINNITGLGYFFFKMNMMLNIF